MTRRGSPEERRWRRWRNMETGSDGSIHGEQPVDPRGRHPREKPSGHRHRDPQPPDEHGAGKHDSTVADNPHGDAAHDSTVAASPHGQPAHDASVAPSPHADEAHSKDTVENQVGSPARRRENRADQPAPADVPVGTEDRIKDEGELLEVATDTDADGTADTWKRSSTRGVVPTQYVTAADSRQRNIDNSDFQANATNDQVTIQSAIDALPVGTK